MRTSRCAAVSRVSPGRGIRGGAHPVAELLEQRAALAVPILVGQPLERTVQGARPPADDQAQRHGSEGGPESRGAHVRRFAAGKFAHQHQRIHVAGLALIGPHAGGRVALEVFDGAIIFARSETDIVRRDVVLQIDELLSAGTARLIGGERTPRAAHRRRRHRLARGQSRSHRLRMFRRGRAREHARAGTDARQPGSRAVGHEHGAVLHPAEFAAGLRMQVHGRGVAACAQ